MKPKKTIISGFLLVFINIGSAILPHLVVKPFWVMHSDSIRYAAIFELLYSAFLLPILLLRLNKLLNRKLQFDSYVFTILLMIISIFVSIYFYYQNYADMTGRGNDPDPGTKLVVFIDLILGLITISIGVGIKYYKERKNRNSNDNLKGVEEK